MSSIAAQAAIELHSVTKRYGSTDALSDCSLVVEQGQFVSLLGPSGCGKTTMLRVIGGFTNQDSGSVRIHGAVVDGLPPNKRRVNTVFQTYALFPNRTVLENVLFPLEVAKLPEAERLERATAMLAMVHLEDFGDRPIDKLSGGQSQRVALARALVGQPDVLLLDEPLAALDLKLRKAMQSELRRIHDDTGTTFIYVTHDQGEAMAMSDRIVLMNNGRILQEADPKTIYDRPASVFASDFLGEANQVDAVVADCAADIVILSIGNLRVAATAVSEGLHPGESVVLSVRPERIRIQPEGEPPDMHMLDGTLRHMVFLGHSLRWLVDIDGGAIAMAVEAPRGQSEQWTVGQRVSLSWDPCDALALKREAAEAEAT